MVLCFAPGCSHDHTHDCQMFAMPSDDKEFRKWVKLLLCRADRVPARTSRICSCHFEDGLKRNGPTIFAHNVKKKIKFANPEKRVRKRRCTSDKPVASAASCSTEMLSEQGHRQGPSEADPPNTALHEELQLLRNKIIALEKEVAVLKEERKFSYKQIKNKNDLIILYTGLPDAQTFEALLKYASSFEFKYYYGWSVTRMSKADQLLLTLMKLRLNVPNLDLATRFGCGTSTVANVFYTWLYVLYETLYKPFFKTIPSQNKCKSCLPSSFASFSNCRLLLDCTEIKIQKPKSMRVQRETYSNYKHANTFKGLVGVAPNGVIVFMSNLYPGSISDKQLYADTNINAQLKPGDMLLVDKGFLIKSLVPPGVHVNMPPFLINRRFTKEEAVETMNIARCRIHVERANARIKAYRILNLIPAKVKKHSSILFRVIGALVNLQNPLIKEIEPLLDSED